MELLQQTLNGSENGNGNGVYEENATYRRQLVMLRRSFGPVVMRELDNEATEDIVLNPDSRLWVKRRGEPFSQVGALSLSVFVHLSRPQLFVRLGGQQ